MVQMAGDCYRLVVHRDQYPASPQAASSALLMRPVGHGGSGGSSSQRVMLIRHVRLETCPGVLPLPHSATGTHILHHHAQSQAVHPTICM